MNEDEADEQERAEAEALARALEGAEAASSEPLETAALLRAVAPPGELPEERARAVHATLRPEIEENIQPKSRPRGRAAVTWLALGLAFAAGVALYVESSRGPEPAAPSIIAQRDPVTNDASETDLPAPPARLLAAQAALSSKDAAVEERVKFEREMRAYRMRLLRTLKDAYPTKVGMLEPGRAR
jgi:hypothetical protein